MHIPLSYNYDSLDLADDIGPVGRQRLLTEPHPLQALEELSVHRSRPDTAAISGSIKSTGRDPPPDAVALKVLDGVVLVVIWIDFTAPEGVEDGGGG